MRIKALVLSLVAMPLIHLAAATPEELQQELVKAIQTAPDGFEAFNPSEALFVDFDATLGVDTVTLSNGDVFDGIRVTVPAAAKGLDFLWYFNVSDNWANWYVCPVEGVSSSGFRNWLNADKVYTPYDDVEEAGRYRVLQTLTADYFEPEQSYVFWFRRGSGTGSGTLRGRLGFYPPEEKWDHEAVETALALELQDLESQVQVLGSRGGQILLDSTLYTRGDAQSQIDSVFWTLRHTRQTSDGFFTTMVVQGGNCAANSEPLYADILERHGIADCVITSDEEALVDAHNVYPDTESDPEDAEESTKDSPATLTYFYDFFGFIVPKDNPMGKVTNISTQANDYSTLRGSGKGGTFGTLGLRNLTAFYSEGVEVGRIYYFLEGNKIPLVIQEPPLGSYHNGNQELNYLGDGRWLSKSYHRGGALQNTFEIADNRQHGAMYWYYPDGSLHYESQHEAGLVHGEVIQYDPSGAVIKTMQFERGKMVSEESTNEQEQLPE